MSESGSILVFLPGISEIRRVAETLRPRVRRPDVDIAPLYGALDAHAQDLAIAPSPKGRRKIVLATSIAETSLTIEGVRVVVDCGLMRVPVYEPEVGLTRLETVRISRANADQRRGRAGRTGPGICYRLWEEAANGGLQHYAAPEILSADLSGLTLDCALWGVADPDKLAFLDSPPRGALNEARALLTRIGAIDAQGRITDEGRASEEIARGIVFYSTPSHGGYHLSPDRLASVASSHRAYAAKWSHGWGDAWYEEDCAAVIVVVTFPQFFPKDAREYARRVVDRVIDAPR